MFYRGAKKHHQRLTSQQEAAYSRGDGRRL